MERPHRTHDACLEWEKQADKLLAELGTTAVKSVEAAIVEGVHAEAIPPDQAQEYLNSYLGAFLGGEDGTA